ncbi:unnamed protein product [Plutella xylostella]|uniref:(diamondback moth) hypothetical protein n=1 Tax=Plutella xylostella TaxID=51655 RepID=A0A8S4GFH4_PLUXY|nr:unnamed protein product [Plutella xylostella]
MSQEVLSREPKHGTCSATRRCRCIVACDVAEQSATSRRHVDDMCLDRFCDNLLPTISGQPVAPSREAIVAPSRRGMVVKRSEVALIRSVLGKRKKINFKHYDGPMQLKTN